MSKDLNKLCRTCLAQDTIYKSIYDDENSENHGYRYTVANIIGNLTNILPIKSDGLPEMVCLPCFNEIKKVNSFKMKCIKSECVLRTMLKQSDEDELMFPNDTISDKLPEQTPLLSCEENNQTSCSTGHLEVLNIKSEEPSCSVYALNSDENQRTIISEKSIETHQTQLFEVDIKEEPEPEPEPEPNLCQWPNQNNESEMEVELGNSNANEETETESQNDDSEEEEEEDVRETNKNSNVGDTILRLEEGQQTDKECHPTLKCPNCDKIFKHLERLKKHLSTNTYCKGNLSFTCSICGKCYNRQYSLQRHFMITHKQTLTKEIVTESRKTNNDIQTEKVQSGENQVQIELKLPVNNEFKTIETLRQCIRCKKVFQDDVSLAEHKKTHKEKPHICNLCNKAFKCAYNLKIHLMNHEQIKPFQCEQCEQSFVRNSCLTRHLKTHMGERPFTCEFCNKGFPYLYALKTHQRSHTEIRPFSCTICSMRFKFPSTLKEHHRTHTGEKPYACKLCPRKLSSKTNFRIHMGTHEKKCGSSVQQLAIDSEEVSVKVEC